MNHRSAAIQTIKSIINWKYWAHEVNHFDTIFRSAVCYLLFLFFTLVWLQKICKFRWPKTSILSHKRRAPKISRSLPASIGWPIELSVWESNFNALVFQKLQIPNRANKIEFKTTQAKFQTSFNHFSYPELGRMHIRFSHNNWKPWTKYRSSPVDIFFIGCKK